MESPGAEFRSPDRTLTPVTIPSPQETVDSFSRSGSVLPVETMPMKPVLFIKIPALVLILGFTSCGTMNVVRGAGTATRNGLAKLTDKITGKPDIQVVEVRPHDLKTIQTGKERALAYEGKAKRSFWFFDGPVDFKEPTLPSVSGEMNDSLLPPKPQ